jgi:hypothetical protein
MSVKGAFMSQDFDKIRYWKDRSLNYLRSGLREFHDSEKNVLETFAHVNLDPTELVKVLNEIEEKLRTVISLIDSAQVKIDKKVEVKEVAHPTGQPELPKDRLQVKEHVAVAIEQPVAETK